MIRALFTALLGISFPSNILAADHLPHSYRGDLDPEVPGFYQVLEQRLEDGRCAVWTRRLSDDEIRVGVWQADHEYGYVWVIMPDSLSALDLDEFENRNECHAISGGH